MLVIKIKMTKKVIDDVLQKGLENKAGGLTGNLTKEEKKNDNLPESPEERIDITLAGFYGKTNTSHTVYDILGNEIPNPFKIDFSRYRQ